MQQNGALRAKWERGLESFKISCIASLLRNQYQLSSDSRDLKLEGSDVSHLGLIYSKKKLFTFKSFRVPEIRYINLHKKYCIFLWFCFV